MEREGLTTREASEVDLQSKARLPLLIFFYSFLMVSDFRFPRYILLGDYWFKSNIRYMLQLFGVSRVVTRFCVIQWFNLGPTRQHMPFRLWIPL